MSNNSIKTHHPQLFNISFFTNKKDIISVTKQVTWNQFCDVIRKPPIREEKDGKAFVPGTFKGIREKKNIQSMGMIAFDFDHNAVLENIIAQTRKLNCAFAVHSSHSHLRKTDQNLNSEPRFRAVIPFAEEIDYLTHETLWLCLRDYLGLEVDESGKDASRMFYTPVKANTEAIYASYIEENDNFFDAQKWLSENAIVFERKDAEKEFRKFKNPDGNFPKWVEELQDCFRANGTHKKNFYEMKCPGCGIESNASSVMFDTGAIRCRKPNRCSLRQMAESLNIKTTPSFKTSRKINSDIANRYSPNSPNSPNSPFAAQKQKTETRNFPILDRKALYGVTGEFVEAVYPTTESHEAALLLQFLIGIGNIFGRKVFLDVESKHYTNLNVMIVGKTSSAKGSSYSQVEKILKDVDTDYFENCVTSGISSGEGLICTLDDKNSQDKRLLVVEPEFASVLKRMKQESNTAGMVIRQFFDSGNANTITRKDPLSAKNAHVSIIGHITPDDLNKYLTDTDIGNGFANRFMFAAVRRSKDLPEGGKISGSKKSYLVNRLKKVLEFISNKNSEFEVVRDDRAKEFWGDMYPSLIDDQDDTLSKLKARGRVFVSRLSLIFALLDCRDFIMKTDIEAAFAVWQYCSDSLKYIFGSGVSLSNDAEKLLSALRESGQGMSKTDISNLFNRKRNQEKLNMIYAELNNFIEFDSVKSKYFALEHNVANGELGENGELSESEIDNFDTTTVENKKLDSVSNPTISNQKTSEPLESYELAEKVDDITTKLFEEGANIPIEATQTSIEMKRLWECYAPRNKNHSDFKEPIKVFLNSDEIRERAAIRMGNGESEIKAFHEAQFVYPDEIEVLPLRELNVKIIPLQPREVIDNRFSNLS